MSQAKYRLKIGNDNVKPLTKISASVVAYIKIALEANLEVTLNGKKVASVTDTTIKRGNDIIEVESWLRYE